jgi:plasmid stabilization system protein ParE
MISLDISPEAECDIEDIADYISIQLNNPVAAVALYKEFYNKILKLTDFPDLGARLRNEHVPDKEYRYLICGNYYIFYRHEEDAVFIIRILYKRRDYMTILFGPDMVNEDADFEYRID